MVRILLKMVLVSKLNLFLGTPTNGQLKSSSGGAQQQQQQQHNGHLGSSSLTGTPNGKGGAGARNAFHNGGNINGDEQLSLSELCPALIKSSSIDTIAVSVCRKGNLKFRHSFLNRTFLVNIQIKFSQNFQAFVLI